jgi:hypothetical protein
MEIITGVGGVIVGLAGLFFGYLYNRQTLNQKQHEEERKEIYKKLNSFYGPFGHLLRTSSELYEVFTRDKGDEFRTLTFLLNGQKLQGNDDVLIRQIIDITGEMDKLIITNSGLIDGEEMRDVLARASAHFRILRLAHSGDITGEAEKFRDYVFPRDLSEKTEKQIGKLKARLDRLNAL